MSVTDTSFSRKGYLARKLFEILLPVSDGLPASTALARLEASVDLTQREAADYPNRPGVRRFEKEVRFTTIPFVKSGWLRKEKGVWSISPEGEAAYRQYLDPTAFLREAVSRYRAWRAAQPDGQDEDDEATAQAVGTLDEAEDEASAAIRDYLQKMGEYEFQDLIAALLEGLGYSVLWVAPRGPDQGIDILATTDPLGVERPRLKVQVKRHADPVPVDTVRAFQAVLGDHDVGIFVNTGGFTSGAASEARGHSQHPITLLDSDDIVRLWIDHQTELTHEQRELLPLKAVFYLRPPA